MYGYIYKTTNLINNKIYIGKKVSNKFVESYLGSGIRLNYAIEKYGWKNFSNEVICWCETKEELCEKEKYYINLYDSTNRDIGYNLTKGGEGGDTIGYLTEEERAIRLKNQSEARKGKPTWNSPGFIKKDIKKSNRKHKEDMTIEERVEHGKKVKEGISKIDPDKKKLTNERKSKSAFERAKTDEFKKMIEAHNKNNKWGAKKCYCILSSGEHIQFNSKNEAANWWMNSELVNNYPYARDNLRWYCRLIKRSINTGKIEYSTKGGNHPIFTIDDIKWFNGEYNGREER